MPRPSSELLTDREAEIMGVLWTRQRATAGEVRAALPDEPHDSTVRTLLRVLKDKGYVRITGRQPAVYVPRVAQKEAQHKAARRLVDRLFGGSADALVLRLLENEHLTPEQLEQLKKQYASQRKQGGRK